jgi:hypothetical protein
MSKKTIIFSLLLVLIFSAVGVSSFCASLSPAFSVISHSLEMDLCGLAGNPISFSDDLFKAELGTKLLGSVKISSLPDEGFGNLSLNGKAVEVGELIPAHSLDNMKFFPETNTPSSGIFTLTVSSCGINYDIVCNLHLLDRLNFAPVGDLNSEALTTFSGVCSYGHLSGYDPDNDDVTFEISSYPKKGILTLIDAKKGRYVYSPYKNSYGEDSFEYTIKDQYGNRSSAICVNITLNEIDSNDVYSDMALEPSAYGATLLSELNIFRGERIGGSLVFSPEKKVCLEDFLMMAMSYSGIEPSSDTASSYSPYTDTARELGFISGNNGDELRYDEIITTAEAAQIVQRIITSQCSGDEYVFAPEITPEESLALLVNSNSCLFPLENTPFSPLSRASAVCLVVGCMSYNGQIQQ